MIPAPWAISLLVPALNESPILPGVTKISLPCSNAKSAVIKEPDFSLASITTTISERAETILFRLGKFIATGLVPIWYSEIIAPPDETISSYNNLLAVG